MKTPLNWLRTHLRIWLGIETLAAKQLRLEFVRLRSVTEQSEVDDLRAHLLRIQAEMNALRGEIAMLKRDVDEKTKPWEPRPFTGWAKGDALKAGDKLTFHPGCFTPRYELWPQTPAPVSITWDEGRVDVRTEPLDTTFPFDPPPLEERMKLFVHDPLPADSTITLKRPAPFRSPFANLTYDWPWNVPAIPAPTSDNWSFQSQPCEK